MVSKDQIEVLKKIAMDPYVRRITTLELREVFEYYEAQQEPKLVVLPVKVAEAIEICKNAGLSSIAIITLMEHVSKLFRDYDGNVLDALTIIKEFAQQVIGGGQDLLSALANGYTVETLESKIKAGVRKIYLQWLEYDSSTKEEDQEYFTQAVTDFVTQVIREEQA